MATDELIANLVRDLEPVQPLPLPHVRVVRWGMVAAAVTAVVAMVIGLRTDLAVATAGWSFQVHAGLLTVAAITSAMAALTLVIPGEPFGALRQWAPVAAITAWAVWLVAELAVFVANGQPLWPIPSGVGCVAKAVAFGLVPGLALITMLGRGAPGSTRATMVFAGLAVAAVGAVGVELTCPLSSPTHILLWHAGPVMVAVLVAWAVGRRRSPEPEA